MANVDLYMQKLTNIANSIRNKLGEQNTYTLEQMPGKIDSIPTGSTSIIVPKSINDNGVYDASSDNADGYNPVTVNVPLGTKNITRNGTYNASSDNLKGYSSVTVNTPVATLTTKTITDNGEYNASSDSVDGYSKVTVALPLGTKTVAANGTYYAINDSLKGYSSFEVAVPSDGIKSFKTNFVPMEGNSYPLTVVSKGVYANTIPYILQKEHMAKLQSIRIKGTVYGNIANSYYPLTCNIKLVMPAFDPNTNKFGYYDPTNDTFSMPYTASGSGPYYMPSYFQAWSNIFTSVNSWSSSSVDYTIPISTYLSSLDRLGYTLMPKNSIYTQYNDTYALDNCILILFFCGMENTTNNLINKCYMEPPSNDYQLSFTYS